MVELDPKLASKLARVVRGGLADPLAAQLLPILDRADTVDLALGFVFVSGVELLTGRLVDVLRRPDARVRILTGDYQDVSDPLAMRRLLQLVEHADLHPSAQLELRVYEVDRRRKDSFHPKAWIIGHARSPEHTRAWVGSSNLSERALVSGLEWNYQIVDPVAVAEVQASFDALWQHPQTRTVDDAWIDAYQRRRRAPSWAGAAVDSLIAEDAPFEPARPRPGIQQEALLALEQTRAAGNRSGLVVLATGLGKTFLSAFDSLGFGRVLFVAHREEILRQALTTYQKVRPNHRLGLYCGAEKDASASVLFASVQTLSAPDWLETWDPRHFDYIVIDEFHHAAAPSYRRLLDHFDPQFLLGLTATPDRLDGHNLLTLTDGNQVYAADIVRGIREDQLAPFHYFGIGDDTQFEPIPWRSYTDEQLATSVSTVARARHAFAALREHAGPRVRALGFCVTQRHAVFMAEQFRALGVACAAVYVGSEDPRVESLARLARGELEVVFCVDMFNEGVDLPELDTVLLLRPTQSPIVFTQQLGRGLRFVEGKTLTVVDLIGNHEVFTRRPELLLELLDPEAKPTDKTIAALLQAKLELPPGVQVAFDLRAHDILEALRRQAARAGTKAERWFREFRDRHGRRPSAVEAHHAGWLQSLRKRDGSWFGYVASADAFVDASEAEAFTRHQALLAGVEALAVERSHVLLTLAVLIERGPLASRRVSKRDIAQWVVARAARSATLTRDLAEHGDPVEHAGVLALLEREVFPALERLGDGFHNRAKHFDGSVLAAESSPGLAALVRELVESPAAALLRPGQQVGDGPAADVGADRRARRRPLRRRGRRRADHHRLPQPRWARPAARRLATSTTARASCSCSSASRKFGSVPAGARAHRGRLQTSPGDEPRPAPDRAQRLPRAALADPEHRLRRARSGDPQRRRGGQARAGDSRWQRHEATALDAGELGPRW